jgi:MFS family permease
MAKTTSWWHVLILLSAGVAISLQIGKVPGAVPVLTQELSLSLFTAGWVISIFNLIAATGGPALGGIADKFGQHRTVIFGMVVTAVAAILGAMATGPATLLLTRTLEGFGFVIATVSIPTLMMAFSESRHRDLTLALWSVYMPTGTGMMMLIGAPLLSVTGWRGLWLLTAAIILLLSLVVWRVARKAASNMPPAARPRFRDIAQVATRRGPLMLALLFFCYAGMFMAVLGFLPYILVEENGMSKPLAATFGAVAVLANVAGNLLGAFALHINADRRVMMLIGCLSMAIGASLVLLDFHPYIRVYGGALLALGGGWIPSTLFTLAPVHAPRIQQLSSVTGMMQQGAAIGMLLMPPALAAIVDAFGSWSSAVPAVWIVGLIGAYAAIQLTHAEPGDIRMMQSEPGVSR